MSPLIIKALPPTSLWKYSSPNISINRRQLGKIIDASVYFRDPTSGRWMGINQLSQFAAASLYKVPIIIAYLKLAESNPSILSQEIYYDGTKSSSDVGDDSAEPFKLTPKKYYTVEELLNNLSAYSDNDSKNLLLQKIDKDYLAEVFSDLSIPISNSSAYTISAKDYSLFFRVLYNATYLSRDMSEKALHILTLSDFKYGLVSGVPVGVEVSHKFGEYGIYDLKNTLTSVELHDCGIIYAPGKPYLLCVMTKGNNVNDLKSVISGVSKIVYEGVIGN